MTELLFKTKGMAQPQGKPRVYFTCHPADFERNFEKFCDDLFAAADCAVYYTADMSERLPEETHDVDLERMNLFVIPVSFRLLSEPNRAMDEDYPFAREKHIPVLPVLIELGLESVYSREDRFDKLQYLDRITVDPTAISFKEKLKKYLSEVLFDDDITARVRKAFDAYVFLSYRKKDRKLANELMRIIHADPLCQRLAIWFDEYLTPGESFTETIRAAMEKSKLFTLLVTPSLLERGVDGKPNYVQSTEYPAACDARMELLSAELAATDRAALVADFPGVPEPLDVELDSERECFLEHLRVLAHKDAAEDPEHNYLLGLAYLDGIDVETDRVRGAELILAAAKAELPEAMAKMRDLFLGNWGVKSDYQAALFWAARLASHLSRTLGELHPDTLTALHSVGSIYSYRIGDRESCKKAKVLFERVYNLRCCVLSEEHLDTLTVLRDLALCNEALGNLDTALKQKEQFHSLRCKVLGKDCYEVLLELNGIAFTYEKLGDRIKALTCYEEVYDGVCKIKGEEDPITVSALEQVASACSATGDYNRAIELFERVYSLRCKIQGEEDHVTLETLAELASLYWKSGNYHQAHRHWELLYNARLRSLGEENPKTLSALSHLALSFGDLGNWLKERELEDKLYSLRCRILGEDDPSTLASLNNLAYACSELKDYECARDYYEKLYAAYCRTLGEEAPKTLSTLNNLAVTMHDLGEKRRVLDLWEKLWSGRRKALGEDDDKTLTALANLAMCCDDLGENEKALVLWEQLYTLRRRTLGESNSKTLFALKSLADACEAGGDPMRAEALKEKLWTLEANQ